MPQIRLRDSAGTLRTVKRIRMRDGTNEFRTISRIRVRDVSNILRLVWQAFTATVSPPTVTGYSNTGAAANITTSSVAAATVGGTSPFTYAWALYGASAYTWVISAATSATTAFTANTVGAGVTTSAFFQVTITDANGATAVAYVEAVANNGQPYSPDPLDRSSLDDHR